MIIIFQIMFLLGVFFPHILPFIVLAFIWHDLDVIELLILSKNILLYLKF